MQWERGGMGKVQGAERTNELWGWEKGSRPLGRMLNQFGQAELEVPVGYQIEKSWSSWRGVGHLSRDGRQFKLWKPTSTSPPS